MKEEVTPGFYTLGTGQPAVEAKPRDAGATRPAHRCGRELYPQSFSSAVELNAASNGPG